jgi:hypothetical protein
MDARFLSAFLGHGQQEFAQLVQFPLNIYEYWPRNAIQKVDVRHVEQQQVCAPFLGKRYSPVLVGKSDFATPGGPKDRSHSKPPTGRVV